jgi:hypothetical protein
LRTISANRTGDAACREPGDDDTQQEKRDAQGDGDLAHAKGVFLGRGDRRLVRRSLQLHQVLEGLERPLDQRIDILDQDVGRLLAAKRGGERHGLVERDVERLVSLDHLVHQLALFRRKAHVGESVL